MDRSRSEMIVNKSEQMQKDGTGSLKVEAIIWFQDHAYEMLPSAYHGYRNLFLNWCCMTDDDPHNRIEIPCDKDTLFREYISNFRKWCDLVSKFGDTSMLLVSKKFALLKKPTNPSRFLTHPAAPELFALYVIPAVFL